jgi:hypothetical protein
LPEDDRDGIRGEDTLANFTTDLAVLDDMQVLVVPEFFDSCKHEVLPG